MKIIKSFSLMKKVRTLAIILISLSFSLSVVQCTELEALDNDLLSAIDSLGLDTLESDTLDPSTVLSDTMTSDTISTFLLEEEIHGILFMREEEKLARDVYLALYEIHPLRPFLNISKSEQAHMDAIKYLIDTYELIDPVADNPEGVFQNDMLQTLYDELIETGSSNEVEALKVGALIEEIDILDLQHELDSTVVNEDVSRVYQNLLSASENHIRAFVRVLAINGVEYVPVKLEQELFDAIMAE